METKEFWDIYCDGLAPAELVWRFGKGDAAVGVREYVRQRPAVYGILRHGSWRETFQAHEQYGRERVAAAMLTHLEMTRDEWEHQVKEYAAAEAAERAAERKRLEAEALALAVARVEAEARERADAEARAREEAARAAELPQPAPASTEPDNQSAPDHGLAQTGASDAAETPAADVAREEAAAQAHPETQDADSAHPSQQPRQESELHPPAAPHASDHGLAQARTREDADAIAAAMARVEAEAQRRAAAEARGEKDNAPQEAERHQATPAPPAPEVHHHVADHGLAQARTKEEAAAIAAAMARVEAEAQRKAAEAAANAATGDTAPASSDTGNTRDEPAASDPPVTDAASTP